MRHTLIGYLFILSAVILSGCAHNVSVVEKPNETEVEAKEPQKPVPDLKPLEIKEIGDGVWVHTTYKIVPPWGNVLTNGLIVERDDFSVLVDTAWNDAQTIEILDWAEKHLNKPVKVSIHTHAHSDKMGGMKALHAKGVETFATQLTNKLALERGLDQTRNELDLSDIGSQIDWYGLSVFYPGGGHSQDNIVVNDNTNNILFGGCMVRPGMTKSLGNTGDANLAYWSQAAKNTANMYKDSQIVVPSHGPPAGRGILENTIRITAVN